MCASLGCDGNFLCIIGNDLLLKLYSYEYEKTIRGAEGVITIAHAPVGFSVIT